MLAVFRDCADRLIRKCKTKRKLTFAILGLDDAGKTTTAKGLSGESNHSDTSATIGFDKEEIKLDKYEITLFDLGGGKSIRGIWRNYLAEVFGIIFVVDSSCHGRMEETKEILSNILENPSMTGKPLLVLANKQDQTGALDDLDVCELLSLEILVNRNQCPCRVESCSASLGTGCKMDKNITNGILWLCNFVDQNYDIYSQRVDKEMKRVADQKKIEAEERKERVKKIREERERLQSMEMKVGDRCASPDQDTGDPFRKLDGTYFEKNTDDRVTTKIPSTNGQKTTDPLSTFASPESPECEKACLLPVNTNTNNNKRGVQVTSECQSSKGRMDYLSENKCMPPVEQYHGATSNKGFTGNIRALPSPTKEIALLKQNMSSTTNKKFLQPLDTLDDMPKSTKIKKKRKKVKRNDVVPSDVNPQSNEGDKTSFKNSTQLNFRAQPPVPSSTSDTTDIYPFSEKWGLVEDLPCIEKLNLISDDDDDDIVR